MRIRGSILCIVFISLFIVAFLFPKSLQDKSPIKVISALRAKEVSFGSETYTAKEPKKNVILVLKIEGISLEEFREAEEKDEIYVTEGKNQYELGSHCVQTKITITSPWFILIFTVPKETLKMELVVINYPHTVFEAEKDVYDRLNALDIKP